MLLPGRAILLAMTVNFHSRQDWLDAEDPGEDYLCTWPLLVERWFCHRCHVPQERTTSRFFWHAGDDCGPDDPDEEASAAYYGPLCPVCRADLWQGAGC
jgi:hypothetical protein